MPLELHVVRWVSDGPVTHATLQACLEKLYERPLLREVVVSAADPVRELAGLEVPLRSDPTVPSGTLLLLLAPRDLSP